MLISILTKFTANTETIYKTIDNFNILILKAELVFLQLIKTFTKVFIFFDFNLKRYIWIKTNTLDYAISDILNQPSSKYGL